MASQGDESLDEKLEQTKNYRQKEKKFESVQKHQKQKESHVQRKSSVKTLDNKNHPVTIVCQFEVTKTKRQKQSAKDKASKTKRLKNQAANKQRNHFKSTNCHTSAPCSALAGVGWLRQDEGI